MRCDAMLRRRRWHVRQLSEQLNSSRAWEQANETKRSCSNVSELLAYGAEDERGADKLRPPEAEAGEHETGDDVPEADKELSAEAEEDERAANNEENCILGAVCIATAHGPSDTKRATWLPAAASGGVQEQRKKLRPQALALLVQTNLHRFTLPSFIHHGPCLTSLANKYARNCKFQDIFHPPQRSPGIGNRFDCVLAALARRRYKREGEGGLYVTARVDEGIQDAYDAGKMSLDAFLDRLEVKVGHSQEVETRRCQYKKRAVKQVLVWHYHYPADRRMLAARDSRVSGCTTQHREYYTFRSIGSFERLNGIIQFWLGELGQDVVKQVKFKQTD
ncbi:hypothetical protein C8R46DRAFT_1030535 [Mycena filopes]|nr:hypothetical protein C8R46DRAFT_1030535 [Mycena filopes]